MKIAIPTQNDQIDNHFGHCEYFTLVDVDENKEVINKATMESEAVCGCKSGLAGVLQQMGVKLLLAGGIGDGAVRKLKQHNIDVIAGFSGSIDEVIRKWKTEDYSLNFTICTEHQSCSH